MAAGLGDGRKTVQLTRRSRNIPGCDSSLPGDGCDTGLPGTAHADVERWSNGGPAKRI